MGIPAIHLGVVSIGTGTATALADVDRAASGSGLEPRFIESAADALSGLTGLPHSACAALALLAAFYISARLARGVYALLAAPCRR